MTFAEQFKQAKGNRTYQELYEILGINLSTLQKWQVGKHKPLPIVQEAVLSKLNKAPKKKVAETAK